MKEVQDRVGGRQGYRASIDPIASGLLGQWSLPPVHAGSSITDFYPEDGGDTFLRSVGSQKIYTAPHPRRRH
jgi:hypothetical protein